MTGPLALAAVVAVPTLAVLAAAGWWLARRRVRPVSTGEKVRAIPAEQWQDQALDVIAADKELVADIVAAFEPDRAKAEHMNRTLRRAEGGDEHG